LLLCDVTFRTIAKFSEKVKAELLKNGKIDK